MDKNLFQELKQKYPFLTVCVSNNVEYVGIIQNQDNTMTSIYDFNSLPTVELKTLFLELGEAWWWESNRSIPINLFLKNDWGIFKEYTKIFPNKNLDILCGPITSLNNISHTKKKRRSITLVRKVK